MRVAFDAAIGGHEGFIEGGFDVAAKRVVFLRVALFAQCSCDFGEQTSAVGKIRGAQHVFGRVGGNRKPIAVVTF